MITFNSATLYKINTSPAAVRLLVAVLVAALVGGVVALGSTLVLVVTNVGGLAEGVSRVADAVDDNSDVSSNAVVATGLAVAGSVAVAESEGTTVGVSVLTIVTADVAV